MSDINTTINTLSEALKSAGDKLKIAQDQFDVNTGLVNDYLRQIKYHTDNGDTNDANIVAITLNNTYTERTALGNNLASAKNIFDSAKKELDEATKNLTPAQESALTAETQTQLANATAKALEVKGATDKQNFAQKNVQYIIIGAIVLIIIIVTIVIIRKRKKSKLV